MEAAFVSPEALRAKYQVGVAYGGLPAPEPYKREEVALVHRIMVRAARYDDKYARQELVLTTHACCRNATPFPLNPADTYEPTHPNSFFPRLC
jgi:hypothetical protein